MKADEIRQLAHMLMFELEDDEIEEIIDDFNTFSRQIALLDAIDTEGVEEMVYPFDVKTEYLRPDVADHIIDQEAATVNAAKTKEGHIVVPKVVH